jgi:hypothetical protein
MISRILVFMLFSTYKTTPSPTQHKHEWDNTKRQITREMSDDDRSQALLPESDKARPHTP